MRFSSIYVCTVFNEIFYLTSYHPTFLVCYLITPPPLPLGVEKVKIRENSEKIRGPFLQHFLGPKCFLGTLKN